MLMLDRRMLLRCGSAAVGVAEFAPLTRTRPSASNGQVGTA